MTTLSHLSRTGLSALVFAAMLPIAQQADAASGLWDTALAVTGSAGNGNGASNATPWIAAPAAGATYAEWNFFNSYPTDSTPDIAHASDTSASLTENTGAAFLTSGGSIYSFAAATGFTLTANAVAGAADVWLRISTLGTQAETTATLNGVAAQAIETYSGSSGSSFGGGEKEWYWKWSNVSASSYTFGFEASESSLSLDQLGVYAAAVPAVTPVPEPQSVLMMVAGLAAMGFVTRRRGVVRS